MSMRALNRWPVGLIGITAFFAPALCRAQTYTITTVAGGALCCSVGDGGSATSAFIHVPMGVAVDTAGNLYIADSGVNNVIRKVTADGTISTVAGNYTAGFSGDGGPATSAQLSGPTGIAVDRAGNLYIVDAGNERIRMVSTDGVIATIAGSGNGMWGGGLGGEGQPATSVELNAPSGAAVDANGNIYVSELRTVRKVAPDGTITTVAGCFLCPSLIDGGPATSTNTIPSGVAVDADANIFIADGGYNRVRKVSPDGRIKTVAGSDYGGYAGDGGPATSAGLIPSGLAVDAAGNIYINDIAGQRVRMVTNDGVITTIAGDGHNYPIGDAGLLGDGGLAHERHTFRYGNCGRKWR